MLHSGATFAQAFAKINLTLDVLGKRPDGYHNLASVMQTIALHDTLSLQTTADGDLECVCDAETLNTPDNLVLRAAVLLRQEAHRPNLSAIIDLHKETPAQGGLGGGSSDAATTLIQLNAKWSLGISPARLAELAAQLGSDVPFFLHGGTALIEGRGEVVTPLPDAEPLWLVLAKPAIGIPTPAVFRALLPDDYSDGADTAAVVATIRAGEPLPFEHLTNALEPGVFRSFPEVGAVRDAMLEAGTPLVRLSGSGPTLFAPFRRLQDAYAVFQRIHSLHIAAWLTHTVDRQHWLEASASGEQTSVDKPANTIQSAET
jgi:4-diphosphocytidyl-2-C-methyl-D-erythritol kinase